MTVSRSVPDPAVPPPADAGQSGERPPARPDRGWRWWFQALGPWVGVAVAALAVALGR